MLACEGAGILFLSLQRFPALVGSCHVLHLSSAELPAYCDSTWLIFLPSTSSIYPRLTFLRQIQIRLCCFLVLGRGIEPFRPSLTTQQQQRITLPRPTYNDRSIITTTTRLAMNKRASADQLAGAHYNLRVPERDGQTSWSQEHKVDTSKKREPCYRQLSLGLIIVKYGAPCLRLLRWPSVLLTGPKDEPRSLLSMPYHYFVFLQTTRLWLLVDDVARIQH